jgi:hypothetical protein
VAAVPIASRTKIIIIKRQLLNQDSSMLTEYEDGERLFAYQHAHDVLSSKVQDLPTLLDISRNTKGLVPPALAVYFSGNITCNKILVARQ